MSFKGKRLVYVCSWSIPVATAALLAALSYRSKVPVKAQGQKDPQTKLVEITEKTKPQIAASYGQLPLSFEPNEGQADAPVKFLSRGRGYTLFLTSTEAVLSLQKPQQASTAEDRFSKPPLATAGNEQRGSFPDSPGRDTASPPSYTAIRMKLAGANPAALIDGLDQLPGKSNYFIGSDPEKWHTNVPTYAKLRHASVYPGIDLVYYGNQQQLEYDFIVKPGADPRAIRFEIDGPERMRVDGQGNVLLETPDGAVTLHKPRVYQEVNGHQQEIAGTYSLRGKHSVGFELAAYDASKPLVIDPILSYSTYLGGVSSSYAYSIAVDSAGAAYVTGNTCSSTFPTTPGSFHSSWAGLGNCAAFVTKFNPAGTALVYSTLLGGPHNGSYNYAGSARVYLFNSGAGTAGYGIAVDSTGNAYVTGLTVDGYSDDFPTTPNAYQRTRGGVVDSVDAFITKLDPSGSQLLYSSYLGGVGDDAAYAIAIDSVGNAYLTGETEGRAGGSSNFPTTPSAFQPVFNGASDAFLTKIDTTQSGAASLVYSTYLGSTDYDWGYGVAADSAGNAYVTGGTQSPHFPTTPGVFGTTNPGKSAFVAKLNTMSSGTPSLVYSRLLGGGYDFGYAIAVDASGSAFITGWATSAWRTTAGAFQTVFRGGTCNAVPVSKLNPDGTDLVYSTYIGGSGAFNCEGNFGLGIALDSAGNAYVTGKTNSPDFPTTPGVFQPSYGGGNNYRAFIAKVNPSGSGLVYSSYYGTAGGPHVGHGIAVDSSGAAYTTGYTCGGAIPIIPGSYKDTFPGDPRYDCSAFAFKVSDVVSTSTALSSTPNPSMFNQTVAFTATVSGPSGSTPTGTVTFNDGSTVLGSSTLTNGQASFVTSSLAVGLRSITAAYSGDAASQPSTSPTLTQTVTKAGQTISFAALPNRTYGSADFSVSATASSGLAVSFIATGSCTISGSTVHLSGAGSCTVTARQQGDANYNPAPDVSQPFNILAAPLTITANNATRQYGQTNPAFTASYSGFVNGETATVLSGTLSCTSTATASSAVSGSPYAITCSGQSSTNYSITYVAGQLTVTPASLTITANNATRQYGQANPAFTASYSGFVNGETAAVLSGALSCTSSATATSAVSGSPYAITCSGQSSTNYSITYVAGQLTITSAALTITANNASKQYGQANPAFTASYSGFVSGESAAALSGTLSCTSAATPLSPVSGSPYPITCSGQSSSNYNITYVAGQLSVTPAPLTITADNAMRQYGQANPAFTASYSGFVNGETASVLAGTLSCTSPATPSSPLSGSPYLINCSGLSSTSYSITYVAGQLTIIAAPLTITANNATRQYGQANPAFTATYSGFVNGETASVLSGALFCASAATPSSPVSGSPYPITCSAQSSTNYNITYVAGQLTVAPAALTIAANNATRQYGQPNPAFTASYSGFVNGETASVLSGALSCSSNATAASPASSNPYLISCSGQSSSNYSISYLAGQLIVTPASLTIAANNATRVYGQANPAFTASYSGFVNGETPLVLSGALSCASPATAVSTVSGSPYPITCSGQGSSNYSINYLAGQLSVTPAPLTITANNATRPYGQANPAFTASYSGFVNSETASVLSGTLSCTSSATASSPVSGSPYPIACSGQTATNYSIIYLAGQLTVTQAASSTAAFTSSSNPSVFGQAVTLTATVSAVAPGTGTPTGTVSFKDGTTVLGSGTLSGGQASFTTASLRVGSHSITTVYSGDANFVSSTSVAFSIAVYNKILFSSTRDGNAEIYAMNPDGSGQTRLTNHPAIDVFPCWSPDSRKIAFNSNRDGSFEIYTMNADGTGVRRLTTDMRVDLMPAWSPNGAKIAFTGNRTGRFEIYTINVDGTGLTRLTGDPAGDFEPVWSPDGTKIAFASMRDGNSEIYVMNADGRAQTRLTTNPAADMFPAWSPDGTKIAFASNRDGNFEIYSMNPNGTGQTRLTINPAEDINPAWSADSAKIVFASNRDGLFNFEIYTMNANGTQQTRLTNNPALDLTPNW